MRRLTAALVAIAALVYVAAAAADVQELGRPANSSFPPAGCPKQCSVIARVTGYQDRIGETKNPFVVPAAGRVVALTVELGKPNASQYSYFSQNFGGHPTVRLAVLQKVGKHHEMRLIAESEHFDLINYLGSTPTFAFASALDVPAGARLALTTETWAPAFAIKRPAAETWRSYRTTCGDSTAPAIQNVVHSTRNYACSYSGARLLFSATFIPKPTSTRKGH